MAYTQLALEDEVNATGLIYEIGSLYAYFECVTDNRKPKGKLYALAHLLVLMMLAELAGEDRPSEIAEWVAYRIEQLYEMKVVPKPRAPSHMTYRRVLQGTVQPEEVEGLMRDYQQRYLEDGEEVVFSMDGKTLKGSIPRGEIRGTHMLSIYVPGQGLVVCQS